MSIHKIGSDIIQPIRPKGTQATERKAEGEGESRPSRPRADQVGFSPEGLALAEQSLGVERGLSPERLEEVESRIAQGFYDSAEVAGEVARRLVDSGDLEYLA